MNSKELQSKIDSVCDKLFTQYPQVATIVRSLCQQAARPFLVGGAVRDALLDLPIKDFDIEVHGISLQQLQAVLECYGAVDLVGKSFGVLRLMGLEIDWSICRTDAPGRKPQVSLQPQLDPKQAFARRDLTVNAMGINLCDRTLYDPFGGQRALQSKVLSATDVSFFKEDPLRFFRVMQFLSRFQMYPDAALNAICMQMSIKQISRERIEAEFNKMMLRSRRPSLGIRWLHAIGRLADVLPDLAATVGVLQRPDYHPEGDVFEHSMQALDAAALLSYDSPAQKLLICYAALFHDIGKAITTELIDGVLKSPEHAEVGAVLAKKDLQRIMCAKKRMRTICLLIRHHMDPGSFISNSASLGAYKRLAYTLWPHATLQELAMLFLADKQGRNPVSSVPLTGVDSDAQLFLDRSEQAGVLTKPEAPIITGNDLRSFISEGPLLGMVLDRVYAIQMRTGIQDRTLLLKRAEDVYRSLCQQ